MISFEFVHQNPECLFKGFMFYLALCELNDSRFSRLRFQLFIPKTKIGSVPGFDLGAIVKVS